VLQYPYFLFFFLQLSYFIAEPNEEESPVFYGVIECFGGAFLVYIVYSGSGIIRLLGIYMTNFLLLSMIVTFGGPISLSFSAESPLDRGKVDSVAG
jgi:hypothetical protein